MSYSFWLTFIQWKNYPDYKNLTEIKTRSQYNHFFLFAQPILKRFDREEGELWLQVPGVVLQADWTEFKAFPLKG